MGGAGEDRGSRAESKPRMTYRHDMCVLCGAPDLPVAKQIHLCSSPARVLSSGQHSSFGITYRPVHHVLAQSAGGRGKMYYASTRQIEVLKSCRFRPVRVSTLPSQGEKLPWVDPMPGGGSLTLYVFTSRKKRIDSLYPYGTRSTWKAGAADVDYIRLKRIQRDRPLYGG